MTTAAPAARPRLADSIQRGESAIAAIGYQDKPREVIANVIADVLHAAEARGLGLIDVLGDAVMYFHQESPDHLPDSI